MKFVAPCLMASVMGQQFKPPMGVAPRQPLAPNVVVAQPPAAPAPAMDPMMLMLMADGKSDMKSLLPLLLMNGGGQMDPMMMMLLLDDKKSGDSLSSLLPLMLMSGGMGGQNGQMDPMMMMLLLDDNKSSGIKDLLPLMLMGGMNGQQGGAMNPLMMTMLLGEDCTIKNEEITKLSKDTVSDEDKIKLATGEKTYTGSALAAMASGTTVAAQLKYVDHDYIKCKTGGSGLSDLLPLMMMGGMGGQPGAAIDPMMMLLLGDSSSSMSDLLPLMMMGGMGGQANSANSMLPLLLLGDDEKTEAKCQEKFKVDAAFEIATKSTVITKQTDAAEIFKLMKAGHVACIAQSGSCVFGKSTWAKEYAQCIKDAAGKAGSTSSTSSSLKKMLPLMLMSGGGAMDPMMMMLALE